MNINDYVFNMSYLPAVEDIKAQHVHNLVFDIFHFYRNRCLLLLKGPLLNVVMDIYLVMDTQVSIPKLRVNITC